MGMSTRLEQEWGKIAGEPLKDGDIINREILVDPSKLNFDPTSPVLRFTFYAKCDLVITDGEDPTGLSTYRSWDVGLMTLLKGYYHTYLRGHTLGVWTLEIPQGTYIRFVGQVYGHQKQQILLKILRDIRRLALKHQAKFRICSGVECVK